MKTVWMLAAMAVAIFLGYRLVVGLQKEPPPPQAENKLQVVSLDTPHTNRWRPGLPAVLRLACWCSAIAGILFLSGTVPLPGSVSAATTTTATFTAAEDTFVRSRSPSTNFGQYPTLQADSYPSVKRILMRFHVTGIPDGASVRSATLRLSAIDHSRQAGEVHAVRGNWSQATTTWSNAPSVGGTIANLSSPAIVGTWREANVTSAVTGNGAIDFYVVTRSSDGVDYISREARVNSPTLTVDWSELLPSPTPAVTSTPTATRTPTSTPTQAATPTPTSTRTPTSTPTATRTPAPTPTPTSTPAPTPTPSPGERSAGAIRLWKNAKKDFDPYTRDGSYADFINRHLVGALVYEPYFDSRLSWYSGAALFYKDAYAIYTDPARNKDKATVDWILRDAAGNACYIPYGSPYDQYAADVGNQAFRDNWIGYVGAKLNDFPGYDGVFVDDVNLSLTRVACGSDAAPKCDVSTGSNCPIDPRTGQPMTNEDWKGYLTEFMEQVRAAIPGELIAHNSIWYIAPFEDPYLVRQIRAADIIQMEQGFVDGGLTEGTEKYSWSRKMAFVDLVHSNGRIVIDRDEDVANREEQSYGVANYLLMNSGEDFYDPVYQSTPNDWWQGYEMNLGQAAGGRHLWNGLWRRDFARGFVLVNPPGGATTTVGLGGTYTDAYGQSHSVVTLAEQQSMVFVLPASVTKPPIVR